MRGPIAVTIAIFLLSAALLAQNRENAKAAPRFRSARTVEVTGVGIGDPIFGIAAGTVWLEVGIDANGKIEDVTVRRGIAGLTPHIVRWVRTWTWRAAEIEGRTTSSAVTVAVTVSPQALQTNPAFPPLKESGDQTPSPSQFLPPQLIAADFPRYPATSVISDVVALDATIDETGQPVKVGVLRHVPPLTAMAIDSLKAWKFAPASLDGAPVAAHVTLGFAFRPPIVINNPPTY